MTNPGQFLSLVRDNMKPRGRCQRWGCLLPVNPSSPFGPGPVCMVCTENLRPGHFPEHPGEAIGNSQVPEPSSRTDQYSPRQDALLREEVLPPQRRRPKGAL